MRVSAGVGRAGEAGGPAVLGEWYAVGPLVLGERRARGSAGPAGEAQVWPEHCDRGVTVQLDDARKVNVGFSPGDSFSAEPYAYVGPQDTAGLSDPYWNAPFGAFVPYGGLTSEDAALAFALDGPDRLRA